ncbi:hypothetical protein H7U19_08155 [Hyunsoonleella sp. SJ7]|uniref:DUF4177 domain-containing protein n=1 Tax=Hyunsoonleella aquatilis TaxID=2762758 RepID=A0A923HHA0_9FLAO|nr:hypothetical protein [Hyunsoonleella aquatilis]MBC3758372.1 hypothetical protein [Hyunsoonleella aquatilis]
MMKKLQLLVVAMLLLFSVDMRADDVIVNSDLNLYNPDVRKCLLEASKKEGWELKSVYMNAKDQLVMVFDKDNSTKVYKTK